MLTALLSVISLDGCGPCKRVAAMSPDERLLFFTLLACVFLVIATSAALYFAFRARLLPGILYSRRAQLPFLGILVSVQRNYHRISAWRNDTVKEALAEHRQRLLHALMEAGADGAKVEQQLKARAPGLFQWSLPFTPTTFVDVLTPAGLRCMLGDNFTSFEKGSIIHDCFEELLGDGIFNTDGDNWRQQRKVASHLFSFAKLNDHMYQTFADESEKLVAILGEAARTGAVVDMQQLFFDLTFDSICRIAFGVQMQQLGSKAPHPFCVAFDEAQAIITGRSFTPPVFWKLLRALNLGSERAFAGHIRTIDEFIYGIVAERRKNAAEYEDSGDLLSLFLADAAKRGEELSDKHLQNLILNFMVAGRDTTATEEEKCATEVREQLSSAVQPSADAIRGLVQVEAAFMETTRLWPPVPADIKECVADCRFPCGTLVPRGTSMIYTPYLLNRLPSFYEASSSPTMQAWAKDCEEFRPQRWLVPNEAGNPDAKLLQPSAFDFVTFNAGLRLCLGKAMAILEGKLVAAAILQNFSLKLQAGYEPRQRVSVVFAIENGLPVTVHLRK